MGSAQKLLAQGLIDLSSARVKTCVNLISVAKQMWKLIYKLDALWTVSVKRVFSIFAFWEESVHQGLLQHTHGDSQNLQLVAVTFFAFLFSKFKRQPLIGTALCTDGLCYCGAVFGIAIRNLCDSV